MGIKTPFYERKKKQSICLYQPLQKPKLKVGKARPKPTNFTDTSFKSRGNKAVRFARGSALMDMQLLSSNSNPSIPQRLHLQPSSSNTYPCLRPVQTASAGNPSATWLRALRTTLQTPPWSRLWALFCEAYSRIFWMRIMMWELNCWDSFVCSLLTRLDVTLEIYSHIFVREWLT